MKKTMSQLKSFLTAKGLSETSIIEIEGKFNNLEGKLDRKYKRSQQNPNELPEGMKKMIFLAKSLEIQNSGNKQWCSKEAKLPLLIKEASFVDAAYELIFGKKDVYLVFSRYFWKINSIEELLSRKNHEGEFAVSKKMDTDFILSKGKFKHVENEKKVDDTDSAIALKYCQQIPGFSSLTKEKQVALRNLVETSIACAS